MSLSQASQVHAALPDRPIERPVAELPEFAHLKSRRALAERLMEAFGLSEPAAWAVANAVVDPSEVRRQIGDPEEPHADRVRVPGGDLLVIRTDVWARRVMPDPRNPRLGPVKKHPFAVPPGSGGESSRHRPLPDPRTPDGRGVNAPELQVDVDSRDHLFWAAREADEHVWAANAKDLAPSISVQGVISPVQLAAVAYQHADGSDPAVALTTVEGSSRVTAVHRLLGVSSGDVPYEDPDRRFRAEIRHLNRTLEEGPDRDQKVQLRCEIVPGLVLLGYAPQAGYEGGFPRAVRSLVALQHVDPPRPWGEGAENEQLADEVLAELRQSGHIGDVEHRYLAGRSTRVEAEAAGFSPDPAIRAARIVRWFSKDDVEVRNALRLAVTSQSTRKRLSQNMLRELATALILRSVDADPPRLERLRKYLSKRGGAYGKTVFAHREWRATNRAAADLAEAALKEVRAAAVDPDPDRDPGPASMELAVRAAYPLLVGDALFADRGTQGNDQPDRRSPAEVLDTMRRTPAGVYQLRQVLRDHAAGEPFRATTDDGDLREDEDGEPVPVTDYYLRSEFPQPGKARAKRAGDTPQDRLENGLGDLTEAMTALRAAWQAAKAVRADGGEEPLVDEVGVEPARCGPWEDLLREVQADLAYWTRRFARRNAPAAAPAPAWADDAEADPNDPDAGVDWDDDRDDEPLDDEPAATFATAV